MATEWFYATNKQQQGPVTWSELRELAEVGILKPHDLVWSENMEEWGKAINQAGLFTDEDAAETATKSNKAWSITDAKPPSRRNQRALEMDDEDEEDEQEAKRKPRKRQPDRSQMAVGVKVALILAGIVFVLLLLVSCGGVLVYLSFGAAKEPIAQMPGGIVANLPNTTWTGRETLQGFGRLEFRFRAGGQVTMIDAKETSEGNYAVQGNTVTMRFLGGQVTYTGIIDGNIMTGNARNVQNIAWTFNVRR